LYGYRPDQVIPPEVRISAGQFWTASDLKIVVERWYDVTYQGESSYRRLLHECRLSQQQTERQYRSRAAEQTVADFEAMLEKKCPTLSKTTPKGTSSRWISSACTSRRR
jgi:transposase